MIKREKKTKIEGKDNCFFVEEEFENEPISKNIVSSIDDFYNLMHLLKKAWVNKRYRLEMQDAGYYLYDEENVITAWIGVKEKSETLMFIIFPTGTLYTKARKNLKGPMFVYDFDEDLWVYSELGIKNILKEEVFENQVEIIKNWIDKEIKKIL